MVASRATQTVDLSATASVSPVPAEHEAAAHSADSAPQRAFHSVARGALALLSTQPLTWLGGLLTAALVPRYLGDERLGQLTLALVIAGFASTVTVMGIPEYLVRRVAGRPERTISDGGAALLLTLGVTFVVATLLAMLLPLVGILRDDTLLLRLALFGLLITNGQAVMVALLRGQERHARFAWMNAGMVFASTCASVAVLIVWRNVELYVAVGILTSAILLVICWHTSGFRLRREAFSPHLWWEMSREGLPFLTKDVAMRIRGESDKIILVILATTTALGWYAAATRIIAIPVFIPTLIATPLLPVLSRHASNHHVFERTLRRGVTCVTLVTVPVCAMIFATAPAIPSILRWPEEFQRAVPLIMLLVLQQPLIAINMVLGTGLIAAKAERKLMGIVMIAATLSPLLNLALIPLLEQWTGNGAIGASIVTILVEVVMLGGTIYLLGRSVVDRPTMITVGRIVLAGALLDGTVLLLAPISLVLAVGSGCLAFGAATMLLRILSPQDLLNLPRVVLASNRSEP